MLYEVITCCASGTAASAARFIVSSSSSAYLPMPKRRMFFSARRSESGSGMRTRASPVDEHRRIRRDIGDTADQHVVIVLDRPRRGLRDEVV